MPENPTLTDEDISTAWPQGRATGAVTTLSHDDTDTTDDTDATDDGDDTDDTDGTDDTDAGDDTDTTDTSAS